MIFWKIHLPFKEKTFINGPRDIINCLQIVLFEYFEKVLTDSCPLFQIYLKHIALNFFYKIWHSFELS